MFPENINMFTFSVLLNEVHAPTHQISICRALGNMTSNAIPLRSTKFEAIEKIVVSSEEQNVGSKHKKFDKDIGSCESYSRDLELTDVSPVQ